MTMDLLMSGCISPLSYFSRTNDESRFCPHESSVVIFIISSCSLFILLAHVFCPAFPYMVDSLDSACFQLSRWAGKLPVQLQIDFEPIFIAVGPGTAAAQVSPVGFHYSPGKPLPCQSRRFSPASFWGSCQRRGPSAWWCHFCLSEVPFSLSWSLTWI